MRRRFFDKIGGDLPTDNFVVFDKSVSDPANITISEDFDFLYRLINSGFYRVLCKSAMGGGEVFVCRLDDNDSNLYFQVIDFQQHCVIAMMLYPKYKTRNLQGVLGPGGAGSSPVATTGSSNATGGVDTKNESSKYV